MEQEEKWIRAILHRGSRKAADQLVRVHYDKLYAFIYRQVGCKEDALDLTQDSFIAALHSLASYDPSKAGFSTWLCRIAAHKVIDARRRHRPVTVPLEEEDIRIQEDFTDDLADRELIRQMEEYVCGLSPQLQEIFRLRLYADLTFVQIASVTMQPEAKIKAQYYRLIKRLRKEFEDHE
ncbi:sigma-70 family RNA polymerase sigma factor [Diplocloster hominis]|uniref:RNA polymerase sigma factor n=1 Tax=Diplocloster hominis TaxID=3079010 RepID=UPI0031B9BA99